MCSTVTYDVALFGIVSYRIVSYRTEYHSSALYDRGVQAVPMTEGGRVNPEKLLLRFFFFFFVAAV